MGITGLRVFSEHEKEGKKKKLVKIFLFTQKHIGLYIQSVISWYTETSNIFRSRLMFIRLIKNDCFPLLLLSITR